MVPIVARYSRCNVTFKLQEDLGDVQVDQVALMKNNVNSFGINSVLIASIIFP